MTERTLADDVEQSLKAEPERWHEEQMIARVVRDDGLTVWTDGTGVTEPRALSFAAADRSRIRAAIALWRAGPVNREPASKSAQGALPSSGTRRGTDAL